MGRRVGVAGTAGRTVGVVVGWLTRVVVVGTSVTAVVVVGARDVVVAGVTVVVGNRGWLGSSQAIPSSSVSSSCGSGGSAVKFFRPAMTSLGQFTSGAGGMQKSG
jgi:hypothetical protein